MFDWYRARNQRPVHAIEFKKNVGLISSKQRRSKQGAINATTRATQSKRRSISAPRYRPWLGMYGEIVFARILFDQKHRFMKNEYDEQIWTRRPVPGPCFMVIFASFHEK